MLAKPRDDRRPPARPAGEVRLGLADERSERPPELDRPADGVAVPERQLARARRAPARPSPGRGEISSIRQLLAPSVMTSPAPALVDHLLVELADPPAGRPRLADHEDAEQPAVRDRPAARHRDHPGVPPAGHDVGRRDPRGAAASARRTRPTGRRRRASRGRLRGPRGSASRTGWPGSRSGTGRRRSSESMTVIATSCWARTSSGFRGMAVASIAPSCIRRVTTAASSRSPRYFGKITPFDGAPTW